MATKVAGPIHERDCAPASAKVLVAMTPKQIREQANCKWVVTAGPGGDYRYALSALNDVPAGTTIWVLPGCMTVAPKPRRKP